MIRILKNIVPRLAKSLQLNMKLAQAGIRESPEEFTKKTLVSAILTSFCLSFVIFAFLSRLGGPAFLVILIFPLLAAMFFSYFVRMPDVKIIKKKREINSELVYAGRFLLIELESGIPLYDAFKNIAKNYETVGKYFSDIVNRVDLGTQMEDALNEAIEFTPSENFRKMLWQIVNAQHTGADVAQSLKSVLEQIGKEQMIQIKEYGRKLNPLAMFYMIIAVILPSIGITMFIILSTFLNLNVQLGSLLGVSAGLACIQFMFLSMIKSSRPSV